MTRRLSCLVLAGLLAATGCRTEDQLPSDPTRPAERARFTISDAARGGAPRFYWLQPSVPTAPVVSGVFDATLLDQLSIEICELSGADCVLPLLTTLTSTGTPFSARIRVDAVREHYLAYWNTAPHGVNATKFYRARVKRGATELGFIDIDIVPTRAQVGTVNTALYVGAAVGEQVTLRFRVERRPPTTLLVLGQYQGIDGIPTAINAGGTIVGEADIRAPSGGLVPPCPPFGINVSQYPILGIVLSAGPAVPVWCDYRNPPASGDDFGQTAPSVPGAAAERILGARAINDNGEVAGWGVRCALWQTASFNSDFLWVCVQQASHAFAAGRFLPQIDPDFTQFTVANAINNASEAVGLDVRTGNISSAVLWPAGGGNPIDLGSFEGIVNGILATHSVEPFGMAPNLSGSNRLIVGRGTPSISGRTKAVIWRNGAWSELPGPPPGCGYSTVAYDVTDGGVVVGSENFCLGAAVVWINDVFRSLNPECQAALGLPSAGSQARGVAVSSTGRLIIVGSCNDRPAVWYDDGAGGFVCELLPMVSGDTEGIAVDVNASGQIVGYSRPFPLPGHAIRWTFSLP